MIPFIWHSGKGQIIATVNTLVVARGLGVTPKCSTRLFWFFFLSDRTVYPDCCGDYTILYMDKTHTTILYSINLKTKTKQRSQPIPPESFPMCMSINRTILY